MSERSDDRDIPEVQPITAWPMQDDDYPPEQDIGQDAGMRMLIPVGLSGWAIASGYLGLISVLLVPGPFAVLTGILASARSTRIRRSTAWAGRSLGS